ncbi:hypothetical protein Bpfe_016782, partial [Biomphalaria pfeifferi]
VNNLQLDSENAKRFAPSSGRGGWGGGVVSRRESTNEALDSDLHENAKRVAPFYGGRWGGTVVSRRESRNEAPDTDRREIAERFALDSGRAENAKRVTAIMAKALFTKVKLQQRSPKSDFKRCFGGLRT